ncbi:MAG: YkgJ family cysteine cluster protein [Nanoarchaeota archaeon]|nr:YkgJ family cysteine cluster protein [Nanoarchaeota archaeon]
MNFKNNLKNNLENSFENNCKKCQKDAHCCIFKKNVGFTFVGIKDAKRIKQLIKKDYDYFLDYSPVSKEIVVCLKNCDPALEGALRYSQLDKHNNILRLKTKKDGRCIFLDKQNHCDIYSIRPNICRIYPFWAVELIDGKIKVIPHDIQSKCGVIKSLVKRQNNEQKEKEIDEILSREEKSEIKKIFKQIKMEDLFYKKNIIKFIKDNDLIKDNSFIKDKKQN